MYIHKNRLVQQHCTVLNRVEINANFAGSKLNLSHFYIPGKKLATFLIFPPMVLSNAISTKWYMYLSFSHLSVHSCSHFLSFGVKMSKF